jgi:hypothetical protein
MKNDRRRKEIVFLAVMVAVSADLVRQTKYRTLFARMYTFMTVIDHQHMLFIPDQTKRKAELAKIQVFINAITPFSWMTAENDLHLWYTLQLVKRLVADGWKIPTTQDHALFIQEMYSLADVMEPATPPTRLWLTSVMEAPHKLRGLGLFV